jgi:hypothetical protein
MTFVPPVPIVPRYGEVNLALAQRWANIDPAQDGPFLAINLMRYRERAEYADGRVSDISGREADDAYTPLGPLVQVGASFVLAADIERQPAGAGFDRLAIVRYPTRRSFMEMQQLEEFQELHIHKDAGMEFTIIAAAEPPAQVASGDPRGQLVVRLLPAGSAAQQAADPEGVSRVARLELEDVVVGDERRFGEARIDRVLPDAIPALLADDGSREQLIAVLATPLLDALALAIRGRAAA